MKVRGWLITMVAIIVTIYGCASIMSGTTQRVTFDSEPQGATVTIGKKAKKGGQVTLVKSINAGVTPLEVELPRRGSTMVQLSKEGFETQTVELKRTINNWFLGDVALLSPLSTSIDTSTGAVNEYKRGQYMVTLQPLTTQTE
jgi:uncharacterized protein YceK